MLEEEYKDFLVPNAEFEPGYDLTICIKTDSFPQTVKISKKDSEEVATEKQKSNSDVRD